MNFRDFARFLKFYSYKIDLKVDFLAIGRVVDADNAESWSLERRFDGQASELWFFSYPALWLRLSDASR